MIAIPDELVEQVKSVARTEALEKFFINKETFRSLLKKWSILDPPQQSKKVVKLW